MVTDHQFHSWGGIPVRIEWYEGPLDVTAITAPAEHPTGHIPEGERHALVVILVGGRTSGWWATEKAVEEHAEPIGPRVGEIGYE